MVVGFSDSSRLEIGAFGFGVEIGADHAGARISARRGKVVIGLGQGDGFLKNLPGGTVEVPFDLGLLADTKNGVRFDGGTGLRVNLPVAATVGGVFTVQYLMLELEIGAAGGARPARRVLASSSARSRHRSTSSAWAPT